MELSKSKKPGAAPIEQILKAAERLPPFPAVIWKVMSLLRRMAPVREIEGVIQFDQAITAKVLTLTRSAYYARRYAIESLRDAIVALGDQQLIRLVMTACASRYVESEISAYEAREGELWEHAVATALLAETAARRLGKKKILTVYTAGLLHDIGKAVLSFYVKAYMDAISTKMTRDGLGLLDAERQTLGIDHQQLGERIARHWRFPPEVVAGIGYHHRPKAAKNHQDIAAAVYVANRTVTSEGLGFGMECLVEPRACDNETLEILGIANDERGAFWTDLVASLEEIKPLMENSTARQNLDPPILQAPQPRQGL